MGSLLTAGPEIPSDAEPSPPGVLRSPDRQVLCDRRNEPYPTGGGVRFPGQFTGQHALLYELKQANPKVKLTGC